jgi:hypothetical protein
MSVSNPQWQALVVRIRTQWVHLTEDDILTGLQRRETFLDRLVHRHHIGLDEAEEQLKKFEQKNPELLFERS